MRGAFACVTALCLGCADPVHDLRVEALGPETPGEDLDGLHRRGQPCVVCHGPDGPAETELALGGTVYERADEDAVAQGATVRVTDASGTIHEATTNQAGNFWFLTDPEILFPARVEVQLDERTVKMRSAIQREGSCAACHADEGGPSQMPRVYLEAP